MIVLVVKFKFVFVNIIVGVLLFNFKFILVILWFVVFIILWLVGLLFVKEIKLIFGLFVNFWLILLFVLCIRLNIFFGKFDECIIFVNNMVLIGEFMFGFIIMVLFVINVGVILCVIKKKGKFYGRMFVVILIVFL